MTVCEYPFQVVSRSRGYGSERYSIITNSDCDRRTILCFACQKDRRLILHENLFTMVCRNGRSKSECHCVTNHTKRVMTLLFLLEYGIASIMLYF